MTVCDDKYMSPADGKHIVYSKNKYYFQDDLTIDMIEGTVWLFFLFKYSYSYVKNIYFS